jgi:hypothetical protein
MKSTTQQIRMIEAKQPKVDNGGMPSRNTPTNAHLAMCSGKNDGSVDVKATVNKVLSRIKK